MSLVPRPHAATIVLPGGALASSASSRRWFSPIRDQAAASGRVRATISTRFVDLILPPTPPFTIDEESSGVIDLTRIVKAAPWFTPNRRYYLGTAQTHAALVDHDGDPGTSPQQDTELVEGGQLYIFTDGGLPE
jgi:hypothetical protein